MTIRSSRAHQRDWIVLFDGVPDRNAAEALRGLKLRAEPLDDPDALWVHELVGTRVVTTDGVERGTVTAVEANPASDLLVLDTGALVPLRFLVSTDDGVVTVDPPEGLFDL
jgi:16S rRNA processing protein RimM